MFNVNVRNSDARIHTEGVGGEYEYDDDDVALLSTQVYGLYTGLVYFTPLIGGFIADRYTGQRAVILFGAGVMCVGHVLMAFESMFLLALLLIIIGMSGFKANVSTQVGLLYEQGDVGEEDCSVEMSGKGNESFRGAADATVALDEGANTDGDGDGDADDEDDCALLSGASAVGDGGSGRRPHAATSRSQDLLKLRDSGFLIFYAGINIGAMIAPLVVGSLRAAVSTESGFVTAGIGMGISLVTYAVFGRKLPNSRSNGDDVGADGKKRSLIADVRRDWRCICAILLLAVLTSFYWMIYEQGGNTIAQFGKDSVVTPFPYEFLQSFNPFFVLGLTFPMMALWKWQGARGTEPSSVVKMGAGALLLALAYAMLALATAAGGNSTHWLILVLAIFLWTVGEMYLSPTGLSFVSKSSPASLKSLMMGAWFLSSFLGNTLSGTFGMLYTKFDDRHYVFFTLCAVVAGVAGALILSTKRLVNWLIRTSPGTMMNQEYRAMVSAEDDVDGDARAGLL